MIEAIKEINWNPSLDERRRFGITLVIGFPLAGLVWFFMVWLVKDDWILEIPAIFATIGIVGGGALAASPSIGRVPYIVWHLLIRAIEMSITYLLLLILFFLVITPIGLLRRFRTNGALSKRIDRNRSSYWADIEKVDDLAQYYRQF